MPFALAPAAALACTPYAPADCPDTNALIVQPGFQRALRAYAGPGRVDWLVQGGRIGDAVVEVLHGPPDAPVMVGPDLVRLSACQAHDCPQKGAAFLTRAGRIQAVAVLHFTCADPKCTDGYTLDVITRDPARFAPLARSWAQAAIDSDRAQFGPNLGGSTRIDRVRTRPPAP